MAIDRPLNRTALIASKRSEIDDLTMLPKNRVLLRPACQRIDAAVQGLSSDQTVFGDPAKRAAVGAGKRSQIYEYSVAGLKCVVNERIREKTERIVVRIVGV